MDERVHRPPRERFFARWPARAPTEAGSPAWEGSDLWAQLRDQLTQDDDDLGHLGTGGVISAPAAGEQHSELRREALWDRWPLAL